MVVLLALVHHVGRQQQRRQREQQDCSEDAALHPGGDQALQRGGKGLGWRASSEAGLFIGTGVLPRPQLATQLQA
jgi:hypothetical protein